MEFVMSSGVETSQVLAEKRDPSTSLGMTLGGDGASPLRLRPPKIPPETRKRLFDALVVPFNNADIVCGRFEVRRQSREAGAAALFSARRIILESAIASPAVAGSLLAHSKAASPQARPQALALACIGPKKILTLLGHS